jgi:uncharacterized protein YcbK (DUF882 family)
LFCHQVGQAVDMRIVGVPNGALFEYCRVLDDIGCGYDPRANVAHVDGRGAAGVWVDCSPAEPTAMASRAS